PRMLVAALALSGLAMWFLALLWHQCLHTFGSPVRMRDATSWYFAGELGKYLPGGVWAVVGRAELARRRGVARSSGYATTVLSLMLMCVGGALVMGPSPAVRSGQRRHAWAGTDHAPDDPCRR